MFLSNRELVELTDFRHELHRTPEISGEEEKTALKIFRFLGSARPDRVITGLGGHGLAAIYEGLEPGPTVMFRCELDGLPIEEISTATYRSTAKGKGHLCGHDGHMTIIAALALGLRRESPKRGRAVLLFQPAEENGAGAAAVIADQKFAEIAPDYAFALHNMPGLPLGFAALSPGPANCASRGIRIALAGKTSHASVPEAGVSPMQAVSALMPALAGLGTGGALDEDYRLVTITHATMGAPAFGISPGHAEIWATLRALRDEQMHSICKEAEALAVDIASEAGLGIEISYHDVFHHCDNDLEAVAILRGAFDAEQICHGESAPMRGSEDFGLFGQNAKAAMFLFGSGEKTPQLHNPDFDFPDALIEPGARIFMRVKRDLLG